MDKSKEIKLLPSYDVAVCGGFGGTAAAMTDDFPALNVTELQDRLQKNGVILHEKDLL